MSDVIPRDVDDKPVVSLYYLFSVSFLITHQTEASTGRSWITGVYYVSILKYIDPVKLVFFLAANKTPVADLNDRLFTHS